MGCAPTARSPNTLPIGKRTQSGIQQKSALSAIIHQQIRKGELSKSTYDRLMDADIRIQKEYGKPLKIKTMDFINKEHLGD